jgi:hypothetical protein
MSSRRDNSANAETSAGTTGGDIPVFVTCQMARHSRWPGIRVMARVDHRAGRPANRRQSIKFGRRTLLSFHVREGETLSFRLNSPTGGVPDLFGSIDFVVPHVEDGFVIEIALTKAAFVVVYGRFRGNLDVVPA